MGNGTVNPYPLALMLSGRRVLVVGGGVVATRRIPALLDAGAEIEVVAPHLTPALQFLASEGRLAWRQRAFVESDVDGAWLVHVAVDDPAAARAVSDAADRRRVFCVRADDRTAATAWTPATTRHGPVTVSVTAGGDPRRAMAVRDAIAELLIAGTGGGVVSAERTGTGGGVVSVERTGTGGGVVSAERTGTGGGVVSVERTGTGGGVVSAERTAKDSTSGLGGPSDRIQGAGQRGEVALVGAGPGDPELITVRGRRLLAEADVVIADRLIPGLLLDELRSDVELIDASKIPYGPAATQEEINRLLVEHGSAGKRVVRLKGGDPFVFGRGGEEVQACVAAGLPATVVPGVTSAIAVPAAAGIPVTHRGVAHEVVVVSGHVPPGHPESLVDWAALARLRGTLCILMGLTHIRAITAELVAHGRGPETPAAVIRAGTTTGQQTVRAGLAELADAVERAGLRPPAVIVIGRVVDVLATDVSGLTGLA